MTSVPAYLLQLAPVTFVQLLLIITAVCLVIIAQCCGVGTTPNIKQSDISFVDTIIEKVKQSPTQRVTDELSNDEVQQLCEAVIFATHGHPAEQQYAFLGDYVNEGPQSPEKIVFLFLKRPLQQPTLGTL
ncbi:hypothetical protein niasHS_006224 [Heterodera schachtii]|uniref:Uncharacterized protein n=1 Tax=Heterodera schachtii TaxID=97005 RepID=A0ABD2JSI7_HETSC